MFKLFEKFQEELWVRLAKPDSWPFLIPLLVTPTGFLFVKFYYVLEFRNAFHHCVFHIICGAGLILTGVLWWVVLRRTLRPSRRVPQLPLKLSALNPWVRWFYRAFPRKSWRRLAYSALIIIGGIAIGAHGVRRCIEPCAPMLPPPDKLSVVITSFTHRSTNDAEAARTFTDDLYKKLKKSEDDAPLRVQTYQREILDPEGRDSEKEKVRAQEFGRCKGAHLVIWGDVGGCNEGAHISPNATIAYEWRSEGTEEKGGVARYAPTIGQLFGDCTPRDRWKEEIDDLANLLLGASFFRDGNLDKAIDFFGASNSEEALLWRGWSYHLQASEFSDRLTVPVDEKVRRFKKALGVYDELIRKLGGEEGDDLKELSARANHLRGDAYMELYEATHGESVQDLRSAEDSFRQSLRSYKSMESRKASQPWQLSNSLGVALFKRTEQRDIDYIDGLSEATKAYGEGRQVLDQETTLSEEERLRGLYLVHRNAASALAVWARQAQGHGEPSLDKFQEAKDEFKKALEALDNQQGPKKALLRARLQTNLANALAESARQIPGFPGDEVLKEAIQIYENDVLAEFDMSSREYALAQKALAETYFDLGERPPRDAAYLRKARDAYVHAIGVLEVKNEHPSVLADAHLVLGKTLRRLGQFSTAMTHLQQALTFFQQRPLPQRVAEASRELRDARNRKQD